MWFWNGYQIEGYIKIQEYRLSFNISFDPCHCMKTTYSSNLLSLKWNIMKTETQTNIKVKWKQRDREREKNEAPYGAHFAQNNKIVGCFSRVIKKSDANEKLKKNASPILIQWFLFKWLFFLQFTFRIHIRIRIEFDIILRAFFFVLWFNFFFISHLNTKSFPVAHFYRIFLHFTNFLVE